jgi:hypothetical protein
MPVPNDLIAIYASGVGGSDPAEDPRWEWTTTHHVRMDPLLDSMDAIAVVMRAWWVSRVAFQSFGVGNTWAANTWLTRVKVVHVQSESVGELGDFTIACGIGAGVSDLASPQVSLLTWAQTEILGVTSRLYIPGLSRGSMENDPPRWKGATYTARLSALWNPTVTAGHTITPVIYSPGLSEVFPITRARYSPWPRTQRRRSLSLKGSEIDIVIV